MTNQPPYTPEQVRGSERAAKEAEAAATELEAAAAEAAAMSAEGLDAYQRDVRATLIRSAYETAQAARERATQARKTADAVAMANAAWHQEHGGG